MGEEEKSEYEKRRLTRIAENKARLETLGLPHLAFSLITCSKHQSKKRGLKKTKDKRFVANGDEEDEEYKPPVEDEMAEESSADSGEEEDDDDDARASSSSRRKGKKRSSLSSAKFKRTSNTREGLNESDFIDDEAALMKAIALSLGATAGDSSGTSAGVSQNSATSIAGEVAQGKKHKAKAQENVGKKKARKLNKARVRLSEDEVVAYFLSFDETGKGYITTRDVKKMAMAHDFSWTDIEIAHMINSFDNDGDGKLSLENFRSIVSRCRMMQVTEET